MNITDNNSPWFKNGSLYVYDENPFFSLTSWKITAQQTHSMPRFLFRATKQTDTPWEIYTDGSTPVLGQGPSGLGKGVAMYHPKYEPMRVSQPFNASGNNFAAELMAILVALRISPVNHPIHIYTDSQACIYVLQKELTFMSERQWLRTAARPIEDPQNAGSDHLR